MFKRLSSKRRLERQAFSLVELVIVIVIIGVIAAVAVPRLSGASENATVTGLAASLTNVRKAVDVYYAEHGSYPGYTPSTTTPNGVKFVEQLLMYSDESGSTNAVPTATHIYGPYLRPPFPKNPINDLDTVTVKAAPADSDPAAGSAGWVAVLSHGYFGLLATAAEITELTEKIDINERFIRGFD